MNLSPSPIQKFFDNNGRPLAGGQLFTYVSGTSTKIATYTDASGGAANTNPIVLDFRGECRIWIDPLLTYTYVLAPATDTDPPTNPIWSVDNISTGFLALFQTVPPWARTRTEIAALAAPTAFTFEPIPEDVRRYGGDDSGGATDSTAEIQATIDSQNALTIKGGAIWLPGDANSVYNISASLNLPARASGDNHSRWYSVRGMGRGAPRLTALTGLANAPMLNATGQDSATYSFYREFKDLYLNGAGIANRGIELTFNQHFKVENVFITSLDDGSSADSAAGVRVFGAICAQFRDIKVHNGDGYGIFQYGGSSNFFNANLIAGCSFLDLAADGMYFSGGVSGCAFFGNTAEFCRYGMRFAGYSAGGIFIAGNYFESTEQAELFIGEDTAQQSLTYEANYLNGYTPGVSATSYTPIRVKNARACRIAGNVIAQATKSATGYYMLDANLGGSVENCVFENNLVNGLSAGTAPNQVYNLPGSFVDFGNSIVDPVFAPYIENNVIRQQLPYGAWTQTTAGAGTITRGAALYGSTATLRLARPAGGDTAQISKAITIGEEFKNRFVTLSIPVRAKASSKTIDITATPNGTGPQATTISNSSLANGDTRLFYVLVFVPSDATTITVTVNMASAAADFEIGKPCLYVGVRQWYSSAADHTDTGVWTPIIGGSGGQSGQAYSSQIGLWVRHGPLVTCYFDVTLSTKGTITTSVVIKGLPFAGITTGTHGLPGMVIGYWANLATNWVHLSGYVEPQNSQAYVTGMTAAAATAAFLATADIGNTTRFAGSFSYLIDQFP